MLKISAVEDFSKLIFHLAIAIFALSCITFTPAIIFDDIAKIAIIKQLLKIILMTGVFIFPAVFFFAFIGLLTGGVSSMRTSLKANKKVFFYNSLSMLICLSAIAIVMALGMLSA